MHTKTFVQSDNCLQSWIAWNCCRCAKNTILCQYNNVTDIHIYNLYKGSEHNLEPPYMSMGGRTPVGDIPCIMLGGYICVYDHLFADSIFPCGLFKYELHLYYVPRLLLLLTVLQCYFLFHRLVLSMQSFQLSCFMCKPMTGNALRCSYIVLLYVAGTTTSQGADSGSSYKEWF